MSHPAVAPSQAPGTPKTSKWVWWMLASSCWSDVALGFMFAPPTLLDVASWGRIASLTAVCLVLAVKALVGCLLDASLLLPQESSLSCGTARLSAKPLVLPVSCPWYTPDLPD